MSVLHLLSRLEELNVNIELVESQLKMNAPKGKLTTDLITEVRNKKEEIIEFLRKNVQGQLKYTTIAPSEKKTCYALSSAQERLYFLQQMDWETTVYNMPMIIDLDMILDKKQLENTFKELVRRHEPLRTSLEMVEDRLVQRIHPHVEFQVEYHDGSSEEAGALDSLHKDFVRPFDLARAPLLRVGLVKTGENRYSLMVDTHHIVCDGISHSILLNDFRALNEGRRLPPLRIQYKDYAEWQNSGVSRESLMKQEAFWVSEFSGEIPLLDLSTDYPRPKIQSFAGRVLHFEIPQTETAALKKFSFESGGTLYMTLLTIFNIFLSKLSGQEDVVIGIPIAGRSHADLQGIIGMFVNTLALRNYPGRKKSFAQLLAEVGQRALKAFENQDFQFQDLVEKVLLKRDSGRNPLFDVMLDLQNMEQNPQEHSVENERQLTPQSTPPSRAEGREAYQYESQVARFDMTWNGTQIGDRLSFGVEYCTALFKQDTLLRFINYFRRIIATVLESPGIKIDEIEIISAEEKKQILIDFNDTDAAFSRGETPSALFEAQAAGTPQKIAVVFNDNQLTYGELNVRANRLAISMREAGVKAGTVVAIMVTRGVEMIIGVIAVQKAGGVYLPVDPSYPGKRIQYMLSDSGADLLLTQSHLKHQVDFPGEIIDIDAIRLDAGDGGNLKPAHKPGDLAYIIYTSGSTGMPKGVMVQNDSYVNAAFGWRESYRLSEMDVNLLQMAAFSFDVFAGDLARALFNGGKLVICPEEVRLDPASLHRLIRSHKISLFESTPALILPFMTYVQENHLEIDNLELLILGSDICSMKDFKKLLLSFEDEMRIINSYGVTEATIDTSYYEESLENIQVSGNVPIGKPLPNMKMYILGNRGQLQPIGIPGELYIGGKGVARGYVNRDRLNEECFLDNPFIPGDRVYKTGDMAKWLACGNIAFLGRMDNQVKVRGYRIELGEIENQLSNHEDIKEAVVIARETTRKNINVCAYFVSDGEPAVPALKDYLAKVLPDFMIPSFFIQMDKLPLTPNGKIDRKALPVPVPGADEDYVAPRDEMEEKLAKIWAEILGLEEEKIGVRSNFFELGGNSIGLILMVSKIYKEFNLELSVAQLYDSPIIESITGCLIARKHADEPVILLNSLRENKVFCFPPSLGYGIVFIGLAHLLGDYSLYGCNFIEEEDRLRQYIELITKHQPEGPYVLFGYSCAGEIICEVTNALENEGHEVSDIIFADCFCAVEGEERKIDDKAMELYTSGIQDNLELLGVEFVGEKVIQKTVKYLEYSIKTTKLPVVNANIHLVLSQYDNTGGDPTCWDNLTTKTVTVYQGFGVHQWMFHQESLPKNGKVIKKILDGIFKK